MSVKILLCVLFSMVSVLSVGGQVEPTGVPKSVCPVEYNDVINHLFSDGLSGWGNGFTVLIATVPAFSQDNTGRLKGVILDRNDARIPATTIIIVGKNKRQSVTSDGSGEFETELPAGIYKIIVQKERFKDHIEQSVRICPGTATVLTIKMEIVVEGDIG